MTMGPVRLRIIFNDNDSRKLVLPGGFPETLEELCQTIKTSFGLQQEFRLQYEDADFGNQFVNLSDISEISDKANLKVIYLQGNTYEDDAITLYPVAPGPSDYSSVCSSDTDNRVPV